VLKLILTKYLVQTFWAFLCVSLCLISSNVAAGHGKGTWKTAQESVVVVNPTWLGYAKPGFGAPPGTAPAGAGFYYSVDNAETSPFIITAAHVVKKAKSIEIINFSGIKTQAFLHALDEQRDIAVLRADLYGRSIKINVDKPEIGSHVCAIGNSFGLGTSMSCGIVSALNRRNIGINMIEDFIQTDAAVNPGMSGGALVDPYGQLIGVVDAIFTKTADIDAGVNFAISVPLLRASLDAQIKAGIEF
jgi:S1-C subfamily serine protease